MGLDTVELVMAVEEEFQLEIPDAAAEKMLSILRLVEPIAHPCARSTTAS